MKNNESDNKILAKLNTLLNNNKDNIKNKKSEKIYENEKNDDKEENLEISDTIKLNLKKEDSFKSMFSVISLDKEKYDKDNLENSSNSKDKRNSIMSQMSACGADDNNNTLSFWETVKLKFNDIKNHILFNYNIFSSPNNLINISQSLSTQIQIFDIKYSKQEDLLNRLKNIPWFSYRENFEQIKDEQNIYTSDAGWGCMLRASQMILAQGLCRLNNINDLFDFISKFFAFFYDNKIPIKYMCKPKKQENKEDKKKEKENKEKENEKNIFNSFEIIDKDSDLLNISFIHLTSEMVEGLENMSERNSDKEFIIPPYSIRNFIRVQKHINKNGKQVGEWFSNYDTIRLITTINKKMNSNKDCDFKVINFNEGVIRINEIIKECFEEYKDEIIKEQENDFDILSLSNIEFSDIVNDNLESDKYIFN